MLDSRGGGGSNGKPITLADSGRGLQLSTSRITVHDLVPYSQDECSDDEIIRWIPSLTHEEIRIVERYYRQYKDELDEYVRRVQAYRAEQMRLQRLRFPEPEGNRPERLAGQTAMSPALQTGSRCTRVHRNTFPAAGRAIRSHRLIARKIA